MKQIQYILLSLCVIASLFIACVSEDDIVMQEQSVKTSVLHLDALCFDFDDEGRDSRASHSWRLDKDTVFVLFSTSDGQKVSALGVYKTCNGSAGWEIQYSGTLPQDQESSCTIYYFDGRVSYAGGVVTLGPHTAVYADLNARYTYYSENSEVSITCTFRPQTSRIRFKTNAAADFILTGMSVPSSFDCATGELSFTLSPVQLQTVSADYTEYVYGTFADADNPALCVKSEDIAYDADCKGKNMLQKGRSGWMNLPTEISHEGWTMRDRNITFTISGVTFKMILVEAGTFQMGLSADGDNSTPVHNVTLSNDYYIGETEVTQELWKAVMGYSPTYGGSSWSSTYGLGDNYPAYYISYNDVQNFITKLNLLVGQTFRMPTEAEWEYAAKGGNKGNDYNFSGGNAIEEVAWYADNAYYKGSSSPDYGTHIVKTKAPNELGIYDMSGNVWEWCGDYYDFYSNIALINPMGATSGSSRVLRGGGWDEDAGYGRCVRRFMLEPSQRDANLGFRLVLSTSSTNEEFPGQEHDYVDLDLPSGTLWATCNVGADTPEAYGDYFAWGETVGYNGGKTDFSSSSYKFASNKKYVTQSWYGTIDNLTVLEPEDDAAYVNWGANWRMPTYTEMKELLNSSNTTTQWTSQKGVNGRLITSKRNGQTLFLPAAGYRRNTGIQDVGSQGIYWTSTLYNDSPDKAYYMYFNTGVPTTGNNIRTLGKSVRPVRRR